MMKRFGLFLCCLFMLVLFSPALMAEKSEALVVDLAANHVDITTGFNGAVLVVFGTKKQVGELVVEVRGPQKSASVRQKNPVLGAWMNTRFYRFPNVYSYYDFGISAESMEGMGAQNLEKMREMRIGIEPEYFDSIQPAEKDVREFQEGLLRNKQAQGFYPKEVKAVQFVSDDLFRAEFYLPPSVPKGDYHIVATLLSRGHVVDQQQTSMTVKQVGFGSYMNRFAYKHSFAYGCICIMIAFFFGWAINLLRRGF